jgi:hypothetical protein
MPVNRSVKRLTALMLAAGAIVVMAEAGPQALGARAARATTNGQGNLRAVPPILRPARPSELAAIRSVEARKSRAANYQSPASARYSMAELNAYATDGSCGP